MCFFNRVQFALSIVTLTREYSFTLIMFKLHSTACKIPYYFKLLLLVYNALDWRGNAPSYIFILYYIFSLLSNRRFSRSLRSTDQELLAVPLAKLTGRSMLLRQDYVMTCLLTFENPHRQLFLKKNLKFVFLKKFVTFNFYFQYNFYFTLLTFISRTCVNIFQNCKVILLF